MSWLRSVFGERVLDNPGDQRTQDGVEHQRHRESDQRDTESPRRVTVSQRGTPRSDESRWRP